MILSPQNNEFFVFYLYTKARLFYIYTSPKELMNRMQHGYIMSIFGFFLLTAYVCFENAHSTRIPTPTSLTSRYPPSPEH